MTAVEEILAEMLKHAKTGANVYPFMFQPRRGSSNFVSAAIRKAKNQGLLVEAGKDGLGKPYYRAPEPKPTHTSSEAMH